MPLVIILAIMFLLSILLIVWADNEDWRWVGGISGALIGLVLFIIVSTIIGHHFHTHSKIAEWDGIQASLDRAREERPSDMELAALQHIVANANGELARMRYWNTHGFDLWWPDAVMTRSDLE